MKRLFLYRRLIQSFETIFILTILVSTISYAQQPAKPAAPASTGQTTAAPTTTSSATSVAPAKQSFHQIIKQKFIEGGPLYMTPILLCFIFGLAIVIERMIYLHLSTVNTDKLLVKIEESLHAGGHEAAKDICRNTKGPVASIFYQGLDRSPEGIDIVEKSLISYGSVQMGLMERGLVWISLFISLAPMLGFFGTVVGLVQSFEAIEVAGDVTPSLVAGGIKVALITTIGGLIVAMILQVFYNYIIAKIDRLVNDMENSSISLVDILLRYNASTGSATAGTGSTLQPFNPSTIKANI